MSEITEPDVEVVADETPVETAPAESPDLSAELEKWKANSRKNELRAKENADKAKRLDEIEEANKTEQQKLIDRAERAEKALEAAESARLRASIAAKHGVPEALLTGSTEEALEEAATALLAFKGVAPSAPSSDGQGKQGQSIGSSNKSQITSVDELKQLSAAEQLEARRDGRLDRLLGKN